MTTEYLIGLTGALGISDQRKRKEIASDMERSLETPDGKEADLLTEKVKAQLSSFGRFETASGRSDDPMKALENAISAILLKEGRFFRSYAIVAAVRARRLLAESEVDEIRKTMRRLAGRFTNVLIHPVSDEGAEDYEVRLLSIGLHDSEPAK
jgi:hypothetical protein